MGGRLFDVAGGPWPVIYVITNGQNPGVTDGVTFANRDGYTNFEAVVGYKAPSGFNDLDGARVTFAVLGDGESLYRTEPMTAADPPEKISVSIRGIKAIELRTIREQAAGYAFWCDPQFTMKPTTPTRKDNNRRIDERKDETDDGPAGGRILRLEPEKMAELARKLAEKVAKDPEFAKQRPTVAVGALMLIPANELAQSNADNVREDLTTALIDANVFDMVERAQLDKVLAELKIGLNDTFDSKAIQRLGKLSEVQGIIIGSISAREGYTVINIRLLDTVTGRAKHAASVELRQ